MAGGSFGMTYYGVNTISTCSNNPYDSKRVLDAPRDDIVQLF
jgi:hypothetical protein